jgi:hypothetical protein
LKKLVVLRERLLPLKPEMNLEQNIVLHFPSENNNNHDSSAKFVLTGSIAADYYPPRISRIGEQPSGLFNRPDMAVSLR